MRAPPPAARENPPELCDTPPREVGGKYRVLEKCARPPPPSPPHPLGQTAPCGHFL